MNDVTIRPRWTEKESPNGNERDEAMTEVMFRFRVAIIQNPLNYPLTVNVCVRAGGSVCIRRSARTLAEMNYPR